MGNLDLEYLVRREQYQDIQRDVARQRWLAQVAPNDDLLGAWPRGAAKARAAIAIVACRLPVIQAAPYCRVTGEA